MSAPDTATRPRAPSLTSKVERICNDLTALDPGPLAELRRMDATSEAYGAPLFWRLLARYELSRGAASEVKWAQVIQALAILTPKGRDPGKVARHRSPERLSRNRDATESESDSDSEIRVEPFGLGRILCDGADRDWPSDRTSPRPVVSEARLAQILGSTGETRVDLVRRVTRLLAARLPADARFDCTDLARLLLFPDDPDVGRSIARDYYARFDRASRIDAATDANKSAGDDA